MQVDFANEEGIHRIESAIAFANPIQNVDTTGIEPMYSVLDGETLRYTYIVVLLLTSRGGFRTLLPRFDEKNVRKPESWTFGQVRFSTKSFLETHCKVKKNISLASNCMCRDILKQYIFQ